MMEDMTAFTWMIALPLLSSPVIYLLGRLVKPDGAAFARVTADSWDRLDLDQQRALVGLFVEHAAIRKGKRGRFFAPTRVQPVPVEIGGP